MINTLLTAAFIVQTRPLNFLTKYLFSTYCFTRRLMFLINKNIQKYCSFCQTICITHIYSEGNLNYLRNKQHSLKLLFPSGFDVFADLHAREVHFSNVFPLDAWRMYAPRLMYHAPYISHPQWKNVVYINIYTYLNRPLKDTYYAQYFSYCSCYVLSSMCMQPVCYYIICYN